MNDDFDKMFEPDYEPKFVEQEQVVEGLDVEEPEAQEDQEPTAEESTETNEELHEEAEPDEDEAEEDPNPKRVPLGTFLDMRDKMKEAARERDDYRKRIEEFEAQQKAASEPERYQYDPLENPQEYKAQVREEIESAIFNERLSQCRIRALEKHTEEELNEVAKWASQKASIDPVFNEKAVKVLDPVAFAIQQYESEKSFELMQRDPIAYARKVAEEQGWFKQEATRQLEEEAPAVKAPAKKAPRSLTGIGSKVVSKSSGEDADDFNAIFNNLR